MKRRGAGRPIIFCGKSVHRPRTQRSFENKDFKRRGAGRTIIFGSCESCCLILDHFKDVDSTALDEHTPDAGCEWITPSGFDRFWIILNRAYGYQIIVGKGSAAITDACSSDGFTVSATVQCGYPRGGFPCWMGLHARCNAEYDTFVTLNIISMTSGTLQITEQNAGVTTVLATSPSPAGDIRYKQGVLSLTVSGDTLTGTLTIDGVTTTVNATSTVGRSNTYCGMRSFQSTDPGIWTGSKNAFDDFAVTPRVPHDRPVGKLVDWFEGVDDALLTARTMDKGGVWAVSDANWYTKNGHAEPRYAGIFQTFALGDAGVSDVDVISDVSMRLASWPDGFRETRAGVVARASSGYQNLWLGAVNVEDGEIELWKRDAGAWSLEGSAALALYPLAADDWMRLRLRAIDDVITLECDRSILVTYPTFAPLPVVTVTDSFAQTNTHCGIGHKCDAGIPSPATDPPTLDGFEVHAV